MAIGDTKATQIMGGQVIDVSFGEWLKRRRRARGWTQKELALRLNCSISALRKMESEERHPSAQVVERLAEVFEIPPDQRRLFLRFARGDWQAANPDTSEGAPFPLSHLDPRAHSPTIPQFESAVDIDGILGVAWERQNMVEKLELIQRALAQAESSGDLRRQMESLWQLGWLDQLNRFRYWEEALARTRLLGDAHELASGLSTLGFFLVLNGDLNVAQTYLAESNALYQQLQLKPVMSHLLSAYGQISLIRGDFQKARAYLQEHARASLEAGSRHDYLWSHVRLGYVALREGQAAEARQILVESAREFKKDRNTIGAVFALEGLAALLMEQGNALQAARLIGWADSTREKISDQRPILEQADVDRIGLACRTVLGDAGFLQEVEQGRKMSLDEAVEYVLQES